MCRRCDGQSHAHNRHRYNVATARSLGSKRFHHDAPTCYLCSGREPRSADGDYDAVEIREASAAVFHFRRYIMDEAMKAGIDLQCARRGHRLAGDAHFSGQLRITTPMLTQIGVALVISLVLASDPVALAH